MFILAMFRGACFPLLCPVFRATGMERPPRNERVKERPGLVYGVQRNKGKVWDVMGSGGSVGKQ